MHFNFRNTVNMASIHLIKRKKGDGHQCSFYYMKDGKSCRHQFKLDIACPKTAQRLADEAERAFRLALVAREDTLTREWWESFADGAMMACGMKPVFYSENIVINVARDWLATSTASQRTIDTYGRHIAFIEAHAFGSKPILSISKMDCEDLMKDFAKGRAKGTVKVFRSTLQGIFKYAARYEMITRNPSQGLEIVGEEGFERKMFSVEDVRKLREFFANERNVLTLSKEMSVEEFRDWRAMMEASLRGAIRLSDNSKLTSDDLTWRGDVLFLSYMAEKTRNTTKKVVHIPCSDLFAALVGDREGPLFPTLYEMSTQSRNGLSARWLLLQEAAGVSREPVKLASGKVVSTKSFHSTRHTCPSWMAAAGVPEHDIREITGHAGSILNEVYLHQVQEEQAKHKVSMDEFEKRHGL